MGRAANLKSIDAVDALKTAVQRFADDATAALGDLEMELRRALDWVKQDRKLYWDQEVRRGWDRVAAARTELARCRVLHKVADHEPGCREEKKALETAKRRLETAQHKVEAVRRWSHAVEKEASEYKGSVNQLAHWLQSDFPRAVAALERMTAALDSYVRLQSTAESVTTAGILAAARAAVEAQQEVDRQQEQQQERQQDRPQADPEEQGEAESPEPRQDGPAPEVAAARPAAESGSDGPGQERPR